MALHPDDPAADAAGAAALWSLLEGLRSRGQQQGRQ